MSIGKRHNADWASILLGLGLGLTAALYLESTRASDWSSVYPVITSLSRICALLGSYLALVGLVLVSRISFIERSMATIASLSGTVNSARTLSISSPSTSFLFPLGTPLTTTRRSASRSGASL